MHFQYTTYVLPLIIAALFSAWIMIYAWQRRSAINAAILVVMAFAITEWLVGYALEIAGIDYSTKLFWGKIQYVGIALVPLTWLVFTYYHSHQGKHINFRNLLLLSIIPLLTVLLAFTTEVHGWVWKTIEIQRSGSFSALALSYGFWFWVHSAYSYILLLAGTVIIVRSLGRNKGVYRKQATALIVALLAPWIGNALYLSGLSPIPHLDLTPFAFTVTLAALAWAIFGSQLVNISPIARDLIVDGLREGMLVLDQRGFIVDINPAAGRMIGITSTHALGKRFEDAFTPWPSLQEQFRNVSEAASEIAVGDGEAQRRYEVRISPLLDEQNLQLGRIITIRALDDGTMPEPRYAVRETGAQPQVQLEPEPVPVAGQKGLFGWFSDFIKAPVKSDLKIPPDTNPKWHQARERSFTLIMRVAALLGTLALSIAPSFTKLEVGLPFAVIVGLFWMLGLIRSIDFKPRTIVFLFLVFVMASIETYNFGYSVASFSFFMTLVVVATLLLGRNGGLVTFAITMITIAVFGISIGSGNFLPINTHEGMPIPGTVQRALTSMIAFAASTTALITAVTILMESLNKAWQLETQALNLLQQERDLLEQRVTERTAELATARDAALENERRFRQIVENASDIIYRTDAQGYFTYVNPIGLHVMGFDNEAELIGGHYLDLVTPSARHKLKRALEHQYMSHTMNTYQEFIAMTADGREVWLGQNVQSIVNGDKTIGFQAVARDITNIKQAQEALAIARDQALEASQLKTQLLSRVSHELRTPLSGILGYSELLHHESYGHLTDGQKKVTGNIAESARYLSVIINDLLDEAQMSSKNITLHIQSFKPQTLLDQVLARTTILAHNKSIALTTETDPNLPERLYGDEKRVQQIVINLVGNAIKFTREGGVNIRLFRSNATHWAIQVSDTGSGIPEEDQKYIFEAFRQVNNAITRENRGTGLGLSIVKQLTEIMDGKIQLNSTVGKGSIFTITLPIITPRKTDL